MLVEILIISHVICFLFTTPLRIVIYKYLKKKSLGMQSVLDLLIIDMIKVDTFNSVSWICIVLSGYMHGQSPVLLSIIWTFILSYLYTYLLSLYQFFVFIKTIVIFKGVWLENINDHKIIWTSRIFAVCYSFLRFLGDFFVQPSRISNNLITFYLSGISTTE